MFVNDIETGCLSMHSLGMHQAKAYKDRSIRIGLRTRCGCHPTGLSGHTYWLGSVAWSLSSVQSLLVLGATQADSTVVLCR